jgi:hypothetical protein
MGELELTSDLAHSERLPLRDLKPAGSRLQPLATSAAGAGLETDHDPDARGRDPERQ